MFTSVSSVAGEVMRLVYYATEDNSHIYVNKKRRSKNFSFNNIYIKNCIIAYFKANYSTTVIQPNLSSARPY